MFPPKGPTQYHFQLLSTCKNVNWSHQTLHLLLRTWNVDVYSPLLLMVTMKTKTHCVGSTQKAQSSTAQLMTPMPIPAPKLTTFIISTIHEEKTCWKTLEDTNKMLTAETLFVHLDWRSKEILSKWLTTMQAFIFLWSRYFLAIQTQN